MTLFVLMAPFPFAFISIGDANENDITYNAKKTVCMVMLPIYLKGNNVHVPTAILGSVSQRMCDTTAQRSCDVAHPAIACVSSK